MTIEQIIEALGTNFVRLERWGIYFRAFGESASRFKNRRFGTRKHTTALAAMMDLLQSLGGNPAHVVIRGREV